MVSMVPVNVRVAYCGHFVSISCFWNGLDEGCEGNKICCLLLRFCKQNR